MRRVKLQRTTLGGFQPLHPVKTTEQKFKDYIAATRSRETAHTYYTSVHHFEQFLDEQKTSLKQVGESVLQDYVVYLSDKNFSPTSVRLFYIAAKSYLEWCKTHGEVDCQSFARPRLPKAEQKIPFILTPGQLKHYFELSAKLSEPVRTIFLILPYCGLRVAEVCRLRLTDISSETNSRGQRWTVLLVRGKGNKQRVCPVFPVAQSMLQSYLAGWRKRQPFRSNWLFPSARKKQVNHISARSLQFHLLNLGREMNLAQNLSPHVLRRTCFTYLYKRGADITLIAKIAGHKSIDTTVKHYIAVSTTDMLDKLGEKKGKTK